MGYTLEPATRGIEINGREYALRTGDFGLIQQTAAWLKKASEAGDMAGGGEDAALGAIDAVVELCDEAKGIAARALGAGAAEELLGDGCDFALCIQLVSIVSRESVSPESVARIRESMSANAVTADVRASAIKLA